MRRAIYTRERRVTGTYRMATGPTFADAAPGDDLRRDPLAVRKATLASLLRRAAPGLRFNEHLDNEDGPLVFAHACKMGLEGIVSKRKDSHYRSGRSPHWIKSENPGLCGGEAGSQGRLASVTFGPQVDSAEGIATL
jgi:hypothetical protein